MPKIFMNMFKRFCMLQYFNIFDGYNLTQTALAAGAVAVKNIYIYKCSLGFKDLEKKMLH